MVCPFKSLEPIMHIGAGGAGFAFIFLKLPHHFRYIQIFIIHILRAGGVDLQGNAGEADPGEGKNVGRGIGNDLKFHNLAPLCQFFTVYHFFACPVKKSFPI